MYLGPCQKIMIEAFGGGETVNDLKIIIDRVRKYVSGELRFERSLHFILLLVNQNTVQI